MNISWRKVRSTGGGFFSFIRRFFCFILHLPSFLIPHSSFVIHHYKFLLPASSFIIRHSSFIILFWVLPVAVASALDLADDFANLQQREYFLRIGIAEDEQAVRVVPHSDFVLHDQEGRTLYQGKAGTPIRFTIPNGKRISVAFFHELASFPDSEKARADALAAQARAKTGLPVLVLRDPRIDRAPLPGGQMSPLVAWMVAAGPYESYGRAVRENGRVGQFRGAGIIRALAGPCRALIQAHDSNGKLLAQATAYLGVRPRDAGGLVRGGPVSRSDTAWAERRSWVKSKVYHGLMEVWGNKNGRLTLVNRVFIEDYLYGVVPPEIGNSAPFEVKKVQAVISRSVAIAKVRGNPHATWHFDLCAGQHCQVYQGALLEHPEANAAVDATWGQVCIFGNNVIDAVFSICCGGATANAGDAWVGDNPPYLRSRLDTPEHSVRPDFSDYKKAEEWIASSPGVLCNPRTHAGLPDHARNAFRWSRTYTASELAALLRKRGYRGATKVTNIRIARRTPSGLIGEVIIDTAPGGAISFTTEVKIRYGLGNLPSAFFTLNRLYDKERRLAKVTINGAGTGHSVGLCQMGAISLVKLGKDYLYVLKHYYEGIQVYKIYQ